MPCLAPKFTVGAAVVVAKSEIARRSSAFGALVASLPLTSLLAFVRPYRDTGDALQVASLSASIFRLVLLPVLFVPFAASLALACAATALGYGVMVMPLRRFGVAL